MFSTFSMRFFEAGDTCPGGAGGSATRWDEAPGPKPWPPVSPSGNWTGYCLTVHKAVNVKTTGFRLQGQATLASGVSSFECIPLAVFGSGRYDVAHDAARAFERTEPLYGPGRERRGTTSATGLPKRVTRIGRCVLRTCSSTDKQVALNLEIEISFMGGTRKIRQNGLLMRGSGKWR